MASRFDAYGRPLRSNGEPGYFETDSTSDYTSYYSPDPRDNVPSSQPKETSNTRKRYSPPISEKMVSPPDKSDPYDVSPELIAAITEKVKREVMEHLKQTGTVDGQPKSPPLQRTSSNSTSSPPPTGRRAYTPPSPTQNAKFGGPPPMDSSKPPPISPLEKPSGVRFSDRSLPTRPGVARAFSTAELTTIDKKWGPLFENGVPTQRLGQFLRGMANHIIEDYSPKTSIVVTPSKMATYYANHAIEDEPQPLLTIFRAQSNEHISRLYQDLGCQHHLVQEDSRSAPLVPALTALGFAHWMTINILAYPEEEWRRLEKVVLAMPINADGGLVDGKPERLPKQISRHLLPDKEDPRSKELLENAILDFLDDLGSTDRRKGSITNPPLARNPSYSQQAKVHPVEIHQSRTSPTTAKAQPIERERNPYSGAPSVSESSTSNDELPVKIERERQPYTAQPGSGKFYSESSNPNPQSRMNRANSTASRPKDPIGLGSHHHRTSSTTSQPYMPGIRPRRPSSPPLKSFSQSTPEDINAGSKYSHNPSSSSNFANSTFASSSYGSSPGMMPPPPGPPPRDDRPQRRGFDDDIRFPGDLNSPRDAEKWDRLQESRREAERFVPYERGPADSREVRGAPAEEWYRDRKGNDYDSYRRYA